MASVKNKVEVKLFTVGDTVRIKKLENKSIKDKNDWIVPHSYAKGDIVTIKQVGPHSYTCINEKGVGQYVSYKDVEEVGEKPFMIGDKVRIRKDSEYYGMDKGNPKDVDGIITHIRAELGEESLPISVLWTGRPTTNTYSKNDLERVELPRIVEDKVEDKPQPTVGKYKMKTGDTVKISKKSSRYRAGDVFNPKDIKGQIINIHESDEETPIDVEWDNEEVNSYHEDDLVVLKRSK